MAKDYYNILGVNKGASPDEIKKAFREKAHKHHPDKPGGDEAKFKELNEAYQILSDSQKRSQYDQYGQTFEQARAGGGASGFSGFEGFGGGQGFNINMDDLGDIFGGFGDIFGFGGESRGRGRRASRGRDIEVVLNLDFKEAIFGVEREISLKKAASCSRCRGSGAEPGNGSETCPACHGSGRINRMQRTILGNVQVQTTCAACHGEGKIIKEKCRQCRGSGVINEIANLKIKIPAGIDSGETIRYAGQGEAATHAGQGGDLYIKVRINPDRRFARDGNDILSKIEIGVGLAALGGKIDIETVDGPVELKIPEGTQSGRVIKLKDRGAPNLHNRKRGDHLVEIIVKIPTNLSRKQKEMLKELGI